MQGRFFLDTNVLVYSFDKTAQSKRDRSAELVSGALDSGLGVISYQVVQEFLNVAMSKFATPLAPADCAIYLRQVLSPLCQVFPSSDFYARGISLHEETGCSFYDSLIVAAALQSNCSTLYSEGPHDGHRIHGLTIRNPF